MRRRLALLAGVLVIGSFVASGQPAQADLVPGTQHIWMRDAQLWSISPNSRFGAVSAGSGIGGLRVVEMATRREIAGPDVSGRLDALVVDDAGRLFVSTDAALVAGDTDGKLDGYRFDLPNLTPHPVTQTFSNDWEWTVVEVSSNGDVHALHATNAAIGDQAAFRYDTATEALIQPDLLFGEEPGTTPQSLRPTLSADGSRMAYSFFPSVDCTRCRHAYVYDSTTNTNRLVDATNVGKPVKGDVKPAIIISENGDHVFFSSPGYDTANLNTTDVRVLNLSNGDVKKIAIAGSVFGLSADGARILYESTHPFNADMMLMDTSVPFNRVFTERFATVWVNPSTRPTISPDGSAVYFGYLWKAEQGGTGTHDIYIQRVTRSLPGFAPVGPARLMDTRPGTQTVDGVAQGIGARQPGRRFELQVAGRGGIPSTASAVTLNVTATGATGDGYVTVWPCDTMAPPNASNLNYVAGRTVPNAVIVGLSATGTVCLQAGERATDLIVDVAGVFQKSADFVQTTPARVLDTRPGSTTIDGRFQGSGLSPAGARIELQIAGRAGVDAHARTVVLNVTATGHQGNGYVTVWPCDTDVPPNASNLNYERGRTAANLVVAMVSRKGTVCLQASEASTHLIADLSGHFLPGSIAEPHPPSRVVDTRLGGQTIGERYEGVGRRAPGKKYEVQLSGPRVFRGGVATLILNITVTDPTADGYLTVWPCDTDSPPNASNLNFVAGQTIANLVVAPLSEDGTVCYQLSGAKANVIIDSNGGLTA